MADKSGVDWLYDPFLDRQGASWNCWWGCTRWSPACSNCYIFRQPPLRMRHMRFDKAAIGGQTPIVYAERRVLFQPLRWRKERMIFVESLGDLWEGRIPIRRTAEMFAIMLLSPWHIYITSTKRTPRQRNWLKSARFRHEVIAALNAICDEYQQLFGRPIKRDLIAAALDHLDRAGPGGEMLPLENVWIGTTVEDNERAAERIPLLRDTPAAVRWLSCEPPTNEFTDPLNLEPWLAGIANPIDWAVFGGESGPPAKATELDTEPAVGLRPINLANFAVLIGQAEQAGVRVFVKQLGEPWAKENAAASKKGSDPAEWPAHLRIRRYPVQLAERALDLDGDNQAAFADVFGAEVAARARA